MSASILKSVSKTWFKVLIRVVLFVYSLALCCSGVGKINFKVYVCCFYSSFGAIKALWFELLAGGKERCERFMAIFVIINTDVHEVHTKLNSAV